MLISCCFPLSFLEIFCTHAPGDFTFKSKHFRNLSLHAWIKKMSVKQAII